MLNAYVPRPSKGLLRPESAPLGQPFGSDNLDALARGAGKVASPDALGRAMARGDKNAANFHTVRKTEKPETPLGGLKPSDRSMGATMGGTPKYKDPFTTHGSH